MADLRAMVEELGYGGARTLLNSGNVVFDAAPGSTPGEAATRIEEALATRLGVSARVIVLDAPELDVAVRDNPLLDVADDPSRLLVAVLNDPADRSRLVPLLDQDWRRSPWPWAPAWPTSGAPRASSPAGSPRPSAAPSATP